MRTFDFNIEKNGPHVVDSFFYVKIKPLSAGAIARTFDFGVVGNMSFCKGVIYFIVVFSR